MLGIIEYHHHQQQQRDSFDLVLGIIEYLFTHPRNPAANPTIRFIKYKMPDFLVLLRL